MKLRNLNPLRLRRHRMTALFATAAIVAAAAALAFAIRSATSQGGGGGGAVDFTKITYSPAKPATSTVPDYTHPSHCQYPEDERPDPTLPPLSCRNTGAEPSAGAIPTVDPATAPSPATARVGWKVIDNRLFRLTVQIPDTWYSNMRPEGGAFAVFDATATAKITKGVKLAAGITLGFEARDYAPDAVGVGKVETKLEQPNASFGSAPGVVWDEGDAEGSRWLRAAFRNGAVVYVINAYVEEEGRLPDEVQADIDAVRAVFATVAAY